MKVLIELERVGFRRRFYTGLDGIVYTVLPYQYMPEVMCLTDGDEILVISEDFVITKMKKDLMVTLVDSTDPLQQSIRAYIGV